jgi:hypothetical protein
MGRWRKPSRGSYLCFFFIFDGRTSGDDRVWSCYPRGPGGVWVGSWYHVAFSSNVEGTGEDDRGILDCPVVGPWVGRDDLWAAWTRCQSFALLDPGEFSECGGVGVFVVGLAGVRGRRWSATGRRTRFEGGCAEEGGLRGIREAGEETNLL